MNPRLHLRDLFWLTLVVALALGWGVYYLRTIGDARRLAAENEMYRREFNQLHAQLELEGYTILHSSIGPFLRKNDAAP